MKKESHREIIKCPLCNKRILDIECKSVAQIHVKCPHCRKLVSMSYIAAAYSQLSISGVRG